MMMRYLNRYAKTIDLKIGCYFLIGFYLEFLHL
jgi:hypothetical protein